ncbi:hypothetical protein THMIRHAM_00980 [Thiomicrorhabdus immobilis]|uniref:DUF4381 domain-containing protein n=1 Tax=Thiomicrorhabdus immobilis TaxID=2791037 RepID=A0ABM7MAF5_9GAMM|nr:hypothetical protein [Thiomicrorhabdus immobilis]BCN92313.1 hypothetical protein THMIRHAM_00980 [Thiomicrorhabdus immobilis]
MVNEQLTLPEAADLVLYDIELPVSPDFDWLSLLQTSAYWLVVLLVLMALIALWVMFTTRHQAFAKQSLLLHFLLVRRQLAKLQKATTENPEDKAAHQAISDAEIKGFYQLSQRLMYVAQLLGLQDKSPITSLQRQANVVAFSEQSVSRETYAMSLTETEKFLHSHLNAKKLVGYYLGQLSQLRLFKGKV